MTDIQNPGAVKPEALTDEQILRFLCDADIPSATMESHISGVARELVRAVRHAARAALELQPEPALTDAQIVDVWRRDFPNGGLEYSYVVEFARAILALGRGVPSSLLEKSEGSFHPAQTLAEEKNAADEGCRGLDTAERVRFYEHDFYPLSNFSAFNLRWAGRIFPTSEHAYHWEKFKDASPGAALVVAEAASAHAAFKLAEHRRGERRKDWDSVKVGVMRDILRAKANQHEYVRRKLLATGTRELVEDSWRDDFWGWGPNRDGQNMLGKLWMEVRAERALGGGSDA